MVSHDDYRLRRGSLHDTESPRSEPAIERRTNERDDCGEPDSASDKQKPDDRFDQLEADLLDSAKSRL
jgi:hypothetical protein